MDLVPLYRVRFPSKNMQILNPFGYKLFGNFSLVIPLDQGEEVFEDFALRSRVVDQATCDLLNGNIDPYDFCDLIEGVMGKDMDAYLTEVTENLENS